MGLVNPLIGLLLLFLNVYDSYKTLKYPPPSRRPSEDGLYRPSNRAISQRKRNLKGVLCIWILWGILSVYERILEPFVSLFIPFYDSFKTMILLFMLLTRARGAEPLYLHVVRPLVKPHTLTMDFAFDLFNMLGSIVGILISLPLIAARSWWEGTEIRTRQAPIDIGIALQARQQQQQQQPPLALRQTSLPPPSASPTGRPSSASPTSTPPSANPRRRSSGPTPTQPPQPTPSYQIWHPPQSAYQAGDDDDDEDGERPGPDRSIYPPLPSAYPPTPQSTSSALPAQTPNNRRGSESTLRTLGSIDAIPEEQPEFQQGSSSMRHRIPVRQVSGSPRRIDDGAENNDEGQEEEEEEDDFDVSFQTPRAVRKRHLPRSVSSPLHTEGSPALSSDAALSTVHDSEESENESLAGPRQAGVVPTPTPTRTIKSTTPPTVDSGSETATSGTEDESTDAAESSAHRPKANRRSARTPKATRTQTAPAPAGTAAPTRTSARLRSGKGSVAAAAAAKAGSRGRA